MPAMPACANAAHGGRPARLWVKVSDLVTAPLTVSVPVNSWVPPDSPPEVAPRTALVAPGAAFVDPAALAAGAVGGAARGYHCDAEG